MLHCTSKPIFQIAEPCVVQIKGSITYNGHNFDEFIPERTSSYIDQTDTHLAELTVRETFDFGARCQGTGHKAGTSLIICLPHVVLKFCIMLPLSPPMRPAFPFIGLAYIMMFQ